MTEYRIYATELLGVPGVFLQFKHEKAVVWRPFWGLGGEVVRVRPCWRFIPVDHRSGIFTREDCPDAWVRHQGRLIGSWPAFFSSREYMREFIKTYPDIDVYLGRLRSESESEAEAAEAAERRQPACVA